MSKVDPELQRLAEEVRRWKNTCLNMMDRYSDLLTAAGVRGHSFFTEDMDDMHEEAKVRLAFAIKQSRMETLQLPRPVNKPKDITK